MTKAGGVAANPTVVLETGGSRLRSKSDAAQKDTASNFGFPDQLSSLENAEGGDPKPATKRFRSWSPDFGRHLSMASDAPSVARDAGRGLGKAADVESGDPAAELAKLLESGLSSAMSEEEGSGIDEETAKGDQPTDAPVKHQPGSSSVIPLGPVTRASISHWSIPTAPEQTRPANGKLEQPTLIFKQSALSEDGPHAANASALPSDPNLELEIDSADMPVADARRTKEGGSRSSREVGDRDVARAEVKVTTVRQETHFGPVGRNSPVQQIADALFSSDTESIQRPIFDPAAQSKSAAPLRVLQVQLQPVDLGTVTVSLSLKADVLEVQLAASQAGTADLIKRDRQMLSDLLRQAGYDIESVNVRIAEPDAAVTSNQTSTQMPSHSVTTPAGQMQSNSSLAEDRSRDARQQTGQQTDHGGDGGRGDTADPARATAPGVYL